MVQAGAKVSVLGAGTMGRGIAQIAATQEHPTVLFDVNGEVLSGARASLEKIFARLTEKGKLKAGQAEKILSRITFTSELKDVAGSELVIEAIVENLDIKRSLFSSVEELVSDSAVLASNTSSLSIASISAACQRPDRVLGVHFFNPAPLMALVEIVPGLTTSTSVVESTRHLIDSWGKVTVLAKDTPGFIVNRVARPFYGESLRLLEEGIADAATIDWALKSLAGFRMGPFELMDLIGNDINLKVTQTVFEAFFFDPRFKPSFTQQRMVEAGRLGRKSGAGYYDYVEGVPQANPSEDAALGQQIVDRVVAMLINEASDAVFLQVATPEDVDLAMTRGVNYPKGLLRWAEEIGLAEVLSRLEALQAEYGEDRYRPNPLLKRLVRDGKSSFFG